MLLLAVVKVIFFFKTQPRFAQRTPVRSPLSLNPHPKPCFTHPLLFCDIPLNSTYFKTCSKMAYRFKVHISKISLSALVLYKSPMFFECISQQIFEKRNNITKKKSVHKTISSSSELICERESLLTSILFVKI
jgi:hypothetical protein